MLDLVVILGWAALAAVIGLILFVVGAPPGSPVARDALAFGTLVLPVWLTFSLQEASAARAGFGKARAGLLVVDRSGGRISLGRSLARSGVKLLPWQLGHSSVFHLVSDPESIAWMVVAIASQFLVLASVLLALVDGEQRALHDILAGTRVEVDSDRGSTARVGRRPGRRIGR